MRRVLCPRVDDATDCAGKVAHVARDHGQAMLQRRRGNQRVEAAIGLPAASACAHRRAQYPALSCEGQVRCQTPPAHWQAKWPVRSGGAKAAVPDAPAPARPVSELRQTGRQTCARPSTPALRDWARAAPIQTAGKCPAGTSLQDHSSTNVRMGSADRAVSSGSPRGACNSRATPVHPRPPAAGTGRAHSSGWARKNRDKATSDRCLQPAARHQQQTCK